MTEGAAVTSAEALQRLIAGNERFVRGASAQRPPQHDRLVELVEAQHPFATILGCSDSRVPPEMVFDQGFGDLFIVRVAGNVVGTETLGSLGYALEHLATPLFVVLGHEGCGAVQAALQCRLGGATEPGRIAELLDAILPALQGIDPSEPPAARLHRAVEANVRWAVRQLAATPAGGAALADGRIGLIGAVYELATGRVRFLREEGPQALRNPS
ncbi:MAG: carbonic anhydrase [Deltaproteobacteria bacterium]|nr:MAG: carbonic anhydrase [Deltaproteobacteria bacterium]